VPGGVVIYTDGALESEGLSPVAGGDVFAGRGAATVGFSGEVAHQSLATWPPRQNRIARVELVAIVIATAYVGVELAGRNVTFLDDSEQRSTRRSRACQRPRT
jgi:hypothetical protein